MLLTFLKRKTCVHPPGISKKKQPTLSTEEDKWTFGISPFYPTINDNGNKYYS